MLSINISFLKQKLVKYGITFENFKYQTGNLVGKVIVPSVLRAYNRDLTADDAFYLVANKVFETANLLAFGIPGRLQDVYEKVVSYDDFKDFQKAIYEEVNQRFLSNTFPEFQNAGSISLSNVNIQNGYIGGQVINDWLNPISRQIIANIDWRKYDEEADIERDKVYMYRSMDNAWLPTSEEKRVILALEDGSVGYVSKNEFATVFDLEKAGKIIKENFDLNANQKAELNNLKKQCETFATKEFVNQVATAFPECERWNPDKVYQIPSFVEHSGSIYWNEMNDNINNVPGGISGENKWKKVSDVFISKKITDLIYKPASDFKHSKVNPNFLYYVNISDLLAIEDLNETTLFNFLDNNFPHLNLTLENTNEFFKNLCDCNKEKLHEMYDPKIKLAKDIIIAFNDELSMNDYISINHLTIDDYEIIDSQKYLRIANNSTLKKEGGSNLIRQSDLPDQIYNLKWIGAYGTSPADYFITNTPNLVDITRTREADRQVSFSGGQACFTSDINIKLNGGVEQTNFEPEYYSIYAIKIKKNIYYEETISIFTNICCMSIEGKIIKTPNENEEENNLATDKNYLYFRKEKNNGDFINYSIKSIENNILNVPETSTLKTYIDTKFETIFNIENTFNKYQLFNDDIYVGGTITATKGIITDVDRNNENSIPNIKTIKDLACEATKINITKEETITGDTFMGKPIYVKYFDIPIAGTHNLFPAQYVDMFVNVSFQCNFDWTPITPRNYNAYIYANTGQAIFNGEFSGRLDGRLIVWYTKKEGGNS